MLSFTDQAGRAIQLAQKPQRIISLVPSQTELLFDLGLNEEVVGITKFCVHPQQWFHLKTRVGGTKQLKMDVIRQLHPDLIIANKEENIKEQVEELAAQYPVWVSDVNHLEDAYEMISQVGAMTGKERNALLLINKIKSKFAQLPAADSKLQTAYLIWKDPYMTIGSDTFIHAMLGAAGFENMFGHRTRYPETTIDDLRIDACQLLLLSSEPFPFKQKNVEELQPLLPDTKIVLVDGEMFSWYGSRLAEAPGYFMKLREQIK
ncbi:MAG: ABC transporter substrate-binding protein [Chitinophagaceae bacterium]|nr:ABC transporter substrate-binding protein [Chitinophagaceae bacterium]